LAVRGMSKPPADRDDKPDTIEPGDYFGRRPIR
jgi:hypothetical protein